jgi:predicted ABC-type ATPase
MSIDRPADNPPDDSGTAADHADPPPADSPRRIPEDPSPPADDSRKSPITGSDSKSRQPTEDADFPDRGGDTSTGTPDAGYTGSETVSDADNPAVTHSADISARTDSSDPQERAPAEARTRQEHADTLDKKGALKSETHSGMQHQPAVDQEKPTKSLVAETELQGDRLSSNQATEPSANVHRSRLSGAQPEEESASTSDAYILGDTREAQEVNLGIHVDPVAKHDNHRFTEDADTAKNPPEDSPKAYDLVPGESDNPNRPLTDAEWAEHVTEVIHNLDQARKLGLETHLSYTIDPDHQVWTKERRAQHTAIINDLYEAAKDIPNTGSAIIAGGLGGAGKTTVLTSRAGIDLSRYLMINPDNLKEEMARRGMIPSIQNLSPMEASELVHEESSHLARQLALRAYADKKNLIWDITMSRKDSTTTRVDQLRTAGYTEVEGIFVDIPVGKSLQRIESRHRQGHEEYRSGIGLGGRYVPPIVTERQQDPEWGSKNRKIFHEMKPKFNSWSVYDNSVDDQPARLIEFRKSHEEHKR